MSQTKERNRRIVLHSRPHGAPQPADFRFEDASVPEPGDDELLLRTIYLSLDPYMRGRMSDGPSYAEPVAVDDVMVGGTVSCVERSNHPDFSTGDLVLANSGWQDYEISKGDGLVRIDSRMQHPSRTLSVLGMPGFTAYMGLLDIGQPQPGETVVVAAATGAVGSVVGQIAKLKGCRVVGVAGGKQKCGVAVNELGFDACIDHRSENFSEQLASVCPKGIDIYFENVGGKVFDGVLPLLNTKARIPLCGLIAHYNDTEMPPGPDRLSLLTKTLLKKRIKMQGFIIFQDYGPRYDEFATTMDGWVNEDKIKIREDIVEGLENAPDAFIGLLQGENSGKLVIRVGNQ